MRFSAHRGVTLVELMISMLILTLVCVAWLEIIGIQSARKEARRREAVERLAGMMDAFMYEDKYYVGGRTTGYQPGYYTCSPKESPLVQPDGGKGNESYPMFDVDMSPIGYQLRVINTSGLDNSANFFRGWQSSQRWLVGMLYNHHGLIKDIGKPFFSLRVCLGQ